jgi:hypothetical protein
MSDDTRLERLEDKVDDIKEEVGEIKTDLKVHTTLVEDKMRVFEDHITGDNKIITHIQPLLQDLPTIKEAVDQFKYEQIKKKKSSEKLKSIAAKLGIVSLVITILIGISKLGWI